MRDREANQLKLSAAERALEDAGDARDSAMNRAKRAREEAD